MATLGHQIYQRMAALGRVIPPDCQPLVADLKDQFDRVAGGGRRPDPGNPWRG